MSLLTPWPCLIFTKFSQLGPGLNTVRTHLSAISKKSESSLDHYGLELPIIVHIVESFTFLYPHSGTPSAQIETFKKLGTFPGS